MRHYLNECCDFCAVPFTKIHPKPITLPRTSWILHYECSEKIRELARKSRGHRQNNLWAEMHYLRVKKFRIKRYSDIII